MPKKKKRPRKPRRPPPQPHRWRAGAADHRPDPDEPPMFAEVRQLLRAEEAVELLSLASALVAPMDARSQTPLARARGEEPDAPSLGGLVDVLTERLEPAPVALLAAFAELTEDQLVARRIRRALAAAGGPPAWLSGLSPIRLDRVLTVGHVLGDSETIMLAARTGTGRPLTAFLLIDHNAGSMVSDGFCNAETAEASLAVMRAASGDDPDTTYADLDPADARARIAEAIELSAITFPPVETGTWPASRALVEWIVRQLPEGGEAWERPEWSEEDREALADAFMASSSGRDHDAEDRQLLDSLLWFACDYGPGDPLRWSPQSVEILLADWLPRKVVADAEFLARAPALLRSLVRYSHAERGVRPQLTLDTLAAVDREEPAYQKVIRTDRPQGVHALMAAMEAGLAPMEDAPWTEPDVPSHEEWVRGVLRKTTGEAWLDAPETSPLPDEPLELEGLPADVHPRVAEIGGLIDACAADLLDVEHRTAARRVLHDVAAADPRIFRRQARSENAAAAILWMVLKANDGFEHGGLTATALGDWFGVGGSPGQRAPTFLKALGVERGYEHDLRLGSARYLVAARREGLLDLRRRYWVASDGRE